MNKLFATLVMTIAANSIYSDQEYKIRTPFTVNTIVMNTVCNTSKTKTLQSITHTPNMWCEERPGIPTCITPVVNEWEKENNKESYTLVMVGDTGASDNSKCLNAKHVYKAIREENKDMVVHLGDHSYADGNAANWYTYIKDIHYMLENGTIPIVPVVGNHEYDYMNTDICKMTNDPTMMFSDVRDDTDYIPAFAKSSSSDGECGVPYNSFFTFANMHNEKYEQGPFWYDVRVGNFAKLYVLSSEHETHSKSVQGMWLRSILKKDRDDKIRWRILCIHRPFFNMILESKTKKDDKVALYHFNSLLDILDDMDIMFTGHQHLYARVENKFIRQVTIGTGGRNLDTLSDDSRYYSNNVKNVQAVHGYGILNVDKNKLCFRFKNLNGAILDAFCEKYKKKTIAGEESIQPEEAFDQ